MEVNWGMKIYLKRLGIWNWKNHYWKIVLFSLNSKCGRDFIRGRWMRKRKCSKECKKKSKESWKSVLLCQISIGKPLDGHHLGEEFSILKENQQVIRILKEENLHMRDFSNSISFRNKLEHNMNLSRSRKRWRNANSVHRE